MWPFTRQRQPAPVVTQSSISSDPLPTLPLSQSFSRIGGSLTPLTISEIIQSADSGNPARLVDLFHECRQKDCHLQAVLSAAEQDITSLEWVVAAPKDPTPAEEDAADLFTQAWQDADREAATSHLVGESLAFGYAYCEIDWELVEGKLWPVGLRAVHCRRFGFRQTDGALLFDPNGYGSVDRAGVDLLERYPGKIVEIKRRINGDVAAREGLARPLVWAALGRNWTYKDWLILGEIGFKPSVIGKYQKSASKGDILHLADVIERFHATGKATIPDSVELVIEWPKNGMGAAGSTHKELEDFLAAEMSKAVLLGTLTIEAGTKGARSLGEVHDKGRDSVRDTNARVVVNALNRDVLVPFTQVNFGPAVRPPKLALVTEDQIDLEKFGKALAALRTAGLRRIPASWVRDQGGVPEAVEGEEILDEASLQIPITEEGFGDTQDDDAESDEQSTNQ